MIRYEFRKRKCWRSEATVGVTLATQFLIEINDVTKFGWHHHSWTISRFVKCCCCWLFFFFYFLSHLSFYSRTIILTEYHCMYIFLTTKCCYLLSFVVLFFTSIYFYCFCLSVACARRTHDRRCWCLGSLHSHRNSHIKRIGQLYTWLHTYKRVYAMRSWAQDRSSIAQTVQVATGRQHEMWIKNKK